MSIFVSRIIFSNMLFLNRYFILQGRIPMNVDGRGFREIDTSWLENSNTPEEVRIETRRLLAEATRHLEHKRLLWTDEEFQWALEEYNEVWVAFEQARHDEIITPQELEDLREQVSHVEAGTGWIIEESMEAAREWAVGQLANGIVEFNEYLVSEWVEGFNRWMDRLSSFMEAEYGPFSVEALIWEDLWIQTMIKIDSLRASPENMYTKLFRLSDVVHDFGEAVYSYIPGLQWNILEEAHTRATEWIIRNILDSWDKVAIWYNQQNWYSVKTSEDFATEIRIHNYDISYISDTEIGTYLCSINTSWMWTEEGLQHLLDVFWHYNLVRLLNRSNTCSFSGESFSWANWPEFYRPYLNGFSEKMIDISVLFFNTKPANELTETLNASSDLPETSSIIRQCELCERIDTFSLNDINSITDTSWSVLEETQAEFVEWLEDRREILEDEARVAHSFRLYYINAGISENRLQELEWELESLIESIKGNSCSIDYIREIRTFNERHFPENDNLVLSREQASDIIWWMIQLNRSENERRLANIVDDILWALPWAPQDEVEHLFAIENEEERNAAINSILERITDETQRNTIRTEIQEVFEIQEDTDAQAVRANIVANDAEEVYQMTPRQVEEYRRLLMSFTGSSININIQSEVHRRYILEKPKDRVILLNSAEDLAFMLSPDVYPDVERALEARNEELNVNDINPSFLNNPQVLDFFVQQDILRDNIIWFLPSSVFRSQDLAQIVFNGGEFLWGRLFENIYGSNTREESIEIMRNLIASHTETFTEREREYLEKAIHREIYEEVLWEAFEENAGLIDDDNDFGAHIDLILNPPIDTMVPTWATISPVVQWVSADGIISHEEFSAWFNEHEVMETLLQYIRVHGLSEEVLGHMRRLVDVRGTNHLSMGVLWMLQWTETLHLDYARDVLSNASRWYLKVNLYSHLNAGMKESEEIIQEMWRWWIETFQPIVIQNITNRKIFAQYLIWYTDEWHDMRSLRLNSNINFLQNEIEADDETNDTELSRREVEALDAFFNRNRQIRDTVENVEGDRERINENHRNTIISILLNEWLSQTVIDSIVPANIENRQEIDAFLIRVWEELDEILEGDEIQRNAEIRRVIGLILAANESAQGERVGLSDREWEYSPQVLNLLRERWFVSEEWNETWNIDFDGITEHYLQNNGNVSPLDDIPRLHNYLIEELWIPEDEVDSITNSIIERIRLEIYRRARERYTNVPTDTPWNNWLDNPPGLYGWAENDIIESISNGEYQYGRPIDLPENIPSTLTLPALPADQAEAYRETISALNLTPTEAETLTIGELETLSNSEEARENFVNFRQRLDDLNLDGIWKFRHGIFAAIGSLDFRINDGDYIWENELNIFLTKVMYATTWDEKYRWVPTNYGEIRDKIYIDNRLGPVSGQEDVTNIWDGGWIIETEFRRLFAPRDAGVVEFRIWAFQQALRGNRENL